MPAQDGNAADRALPKCADAARAGADFAPLSSFGALTLSDLLRPILPVEEPLDAIVLSDGTSEEPLDAIVLPDASLEESAQPIPVVLRIDYVELPLVVAYHAPNARGNMLWGAALACGVALAILLNVEPAARPSLNTRGGVSAAGQGTGSSHADALGANFTATRCGYAANKYAPNRASRCVLEGTLEALGDQMRTRGRLLHEQAIRHSAVHAAATQPLPPVGQHFQGSP